MKNKFYSNMSKKIAQGALTAMLVFSLVGCGSNDTSDTKVIDGSGSNTTTTNYDGTSGSDSSISGYYLTYKDLNITVDSDIAEYTGILGEPESYFESPSCAGEGTGKLYSYSDIEIQTYPDGDIDRVLYVLLRTDNVTTNEGIDLSNTMDEVKDVYGKPSTETSNSLTYEKDGMTLNFLFDGDSMISIEYDSSKN